MVKDWHMSNSGPIFCFSQETEEGAGHRQAEVEQDSQDEQDEVLARGTGAITNFAPLACERRPAADLIHFLCVKDTASWPISLLVHVADTQLLNLFTPCVCEGQLTFFTRVWRTQPADCIHSLCEWRTQPADWIHSLCEWRTQPADCIHSLCEWRKQPADPLIWEGEADSLPVCEGHTMCWACSLCVCKGCTAHWLHSLFVHAWTAACRQDTLSTGCCPSG